MSFPANPEKSIFWVLSPAKEMSPGVAVAISENLLVTCRHVVQDAKEVGLISHHPVFEGEATAKGKIIRTSDDEGLDLALLHSSCRLPFLELEDGEILDDSVPLRVWSWSNLKNPSPHAAVRTGFWPFRPDSTIEDNISRFTFAGHANEGMSGGPVVSALTNKIVGIILGGWKKDSIPPREIGETWWLETPPDTFSDEDRRSLLKVGRQQVEVITAQLELGMGIALSLKELKTFLER